MSYSIQTRPGGNYEDYDRGDVRSFEIVVFEQDYKELCSWVLRHKNIETGGDLFGLWLDNRKAVIQIALGPGKECRRSGTSFFQDLNYLEEVGSYLTNSEGLCHIGEWHSHHQLGLAVPSGGDESTVWNNMPTYGLDRFVIFIANIERSRKNSATVNVGCFLFEFARRGEKQERLPVLPGRFKLLPGKSPFREKEEIQTRMKGQAEPPMMSERESQGFRIEYKDRADRNIVGIWENGEKEGDKKRQQDSVPWEQKRMKKNFSKEEKSVGFPSKRHRLLPNDPNEDAIIEQPSSTTATTSGKTSPSEETVFGRCCQFMHRFFCPNCW